MFKLIGIIVIGLLAGVLIYASLQPDRFRVERKARIQAPPERIYPLISDFRNWRQWSPYETKDPALRRDYSGAASGTGAIYAWQGNKEVGEGRMEITAESPPTGLTIRINFIKPFQAQNSVQFALTPRDGATEVSWSIEGDMPFISKVMCLFFDMDKMIGGDYEKGLATLKTVAEG